MTFFGSILTQTGRNLSKTWGAQLLTLLSVSLSILIFIFFFLIYLNLLQAGARLEDQLRLVVYLEDEVVPEMQVNLRQKIIDYTPVEKIVFLSRQQAFDRLSEQLQDNRDILADLTPAFLPASIEIYPGSELKQLARLKQFSDYLMTLPGAQKVQYGQEWVERLGSFTELFRLIVIISGIILLLSTTFLVSYTIRLTLVARQEELEILRLLGANNSYIQGPLLLEGFLQGLTGATAGILLLYLLLEWMRNHLSGPGFLTGFELTFFPPAITIGIVGASVLLCVGGSLFSIRKYLRV